MKNRKRMKVKGERNSSNTFKKWLNELLPSHLEKKNRKKRVPLQQVRKKTTEAIKRNSQEKGTNLPEDHKAVGCPQVLQLVCDQDTTLVLQQATNTPDCKHRHASLQFNV